MVDKNFQEDLQKMIKEGLVVIDSKGEMKITDKGLKQSADLLQNDRGAKEYMKQIAKHFGDSSIKETVNIKDIADEIDMVDSIKLDIYERFGISINDDLKNYQLYCKLLNINKDEDMDGLKTERLKKGYKQMASLFNTQYELLREAKYFEIPENINLLLSNTSNEIRKVRFPYYFTFLDTSLIVLDRTYYSFFITDFDSFEESTKKIKKDKERINIMTFYEGEDSMGYDNFNLYDKDKNKYRNKIREYMINFVDFVNSEDVKLMFRERTENNTQRRIQRGKIPIPSFNKIYVVGYLKKYLDKLESNELGTRFSHRFWVRGHFKRFLNKNKYKKLYEKYKKGELKNLEGKKYHVNDGFLRVWVYPYIKGDGMLIEKGYKLE